MSVRPTAVAVVVALLFAAGALVYALSSTSGDVEENAATLEDLCQVARIQRQILVEQHTNTRIYLESPAGREPTGLNDFIRKISQPRLEQRLKVEQVPASCRPGQKP